MENKPDTSFPTLAARGHRPRIGKEPRVLLSSTTVDPLTKSTLADWQAQTGRNLGGVLASLKQLLRKLVLIKRNLRKLVVAVLHGS
jgi:hypothetical protein